MIDDIFGVPDDTFIYPLPQTTFVVLLVDDAVAEADGLFFEFWSLGEPGAVVCGVVEADAALVVDGCVGSVGSCRLGRWLRGVCGVAAL